ncbi:MAG TPA: hypothetical protein VLL08_00090 [Kineosporiaceae bacterium]|nr:hypothetical protein [Kineosporiaceae bacterium]
MPGILPQSGSVPRPTPLPLLSAGPTIIAAWPPGELANLTA